MMIIDSLAYRSRYRWIHPGKKMILTFLLLLADLISQNIFSGLCLTVILGIFIIKGGVPVKVYLKLMCLPFVFILFSLAAIVVNVTADPGEGILICSLGPVYLSLAPEGVVSGVFLFFRAFGAVSCLYFLALSTPMTDILYVFEAMHCPHLLIELMLLIYRYIFLLWSIAGELKKASDGRLGNRNFRKSVRTAGQIFTALFIRAFQRSSAIYDAMESRGYDGTIRVIPGFKKNRQKNE